MNNSYSRSIGWMALSIGITSFMGLTIYGMAGFGVLTSYVLTMRPFNMTPFLSITPLLAIRAFIIVIGALLNLRFVWMIYLDFRAKLTWFSPFMLMIGMIGSFIVLIGSAFELLNRIVGHNLIIWFPLGQTLSIIVAGYGFIGIWLLLLNYQARLHDTWSRRLAWSGIIAGAMMAIGLLSIPRIFIPYVSLYHLIVPELGELAGSLGWMFFYPIWCISLGFVYLKGMYGGEHPQNFVPLRTAPSQRE
ncbi:MAG TPA: hypothetical protein VN843_08660 [Anaerolineales bacterium]|nr:hypothetical protein [Anaerolineales bacterium]